MSCLAVVAAVNDETQQTNIVTAEIKSCSVVTAVFTSYCDAGGDGVVLAAGGRGEGGVCGGLAAGGGLLLQGVRRGDGLVRGPAGQPWL